MSPSNKHLILILGMVYALTACNSYNQFDEKKFIKDPIDPDLNLSRQQYKDAIRPKVDGETSHKVSGSDDNITTQAEIKGNKKGKNARSKPLALASIVTAPDGPPTVSNKLVSLSVTEDVPIRDVLMELTRMADLELALDPNITGGVILQVRDRSVTEVMSLIAELASLRYDISNGVLHVQKDLPYMVNYQADYINLVRSGKSSISTQTQVLSIQANTGSSGSSGNSSGGGGSGSEDSGLNSGSTNAITAEYNGDIWASIENNIRSILNANIKDQSTAEDNAVVQTISDNGNVNNNAKTATGAKPSTMFYAINRQAGIISVMANSEKHKQISNYLQKVKANLSAQILIEAKLVEVSLNEQYSAGIDWGGLQGKGFLSSLNVAPTSLPSGSVFSGVLQADLLSLSKRPSTVNKSTVALNFLEGFGTTRVLQNPRVSALNNQQAMLTFAVNKPYFTIQGTLQNPITNAAGVQVAQPVSITSQLHTIPLGVILTLQPSINPETQEITMNIRPTISKEVLGQSITDPGVQILSQSLGGGNLPAISSTIPTVEVREMDTVLKLKSGDIMLIGGLIENTDSNTDAGVPGISGLPFFGNFLKSVSKTTGLKETVILLQATIVSSASYHPQDKAIYEQFAQDPRPLAF